MATSIKSINHCYLLVSYVKRSFTYYKIIKSKEIPGHEKWTEVPNDDSFYVEFGDEMVLCKVIMTSNDEDELKTILNDPEKAYHNAIELEACIYPLLLYDYHGNKIYVLGTNGTRVSENWLNRIVWTDYQVATYHLLTAVFGQRILATHTLTGRQFPKPQLDPKKVEDVVSILVDKCGVTEEVIREEIKKRCHLEYLKYK